MECSRLRAAACTSGVLIELDQVAARVGEHGDRFCSRLHRRLGECDPARGEPLVFGGEVRRFERRRRDALFEQRLLERLAGGVGVRLQRQLEVVGAFRRDDGDPTVGACHREVPLLLEAEHLDVEAQGLVLIVYHDAVQFDPHGRDRGTGTRGPLVESCAAFGQAPGSGVIKLMQPGAGARAGGRRLYADGVTPRWRSNRWLKLPGLEKPTSRHASVTERPPASSCCARSRRRWVRYWCGVTPNNARKLRIKKNGDSPTSRATVPSGRGSSPSSSVRTRHRRLNTAGEMSIARRAYPPLGAWRLRLLDGASALRHAELEQALLVGRAADLAPQLLLRHAALPRHVAQQELPRLALLLVEVGRGVAAAVRRVVDLAVAVVVEAVRAGRRRPARRRARGG